MRRDVLRWLAGAMAAAMVLSAGPAGAQEGQLDLIRRDVRSPRTKPPSDNAVPGPDTASAEYRYSDEFGKSDEDDTGFWETLATPLATSGAAVGLVLAASPIWVPHGLMGDDFAIEAEFPRFPYDHTPGYMLVDNWSPRARWWAGRFQAEFRDDFDRLEHAGGRLLLETTSRWGLDLRATHFEERLASGRHDTLWLGDANLVFRFAQSEHWQWRGGVGLNWLDDRFDTDFGVNLTYGFDFFPRRPWVLSTTLDWGTLGSAQRFRLATTAGVALHGIETYTGYEFQSIDRFHANSLVAGVRIWF
ncbi:MAG: hypothetical protein JW809_05150 [Pirellulales bacterium]|nr:hypothetical protein [Pirellulales bacterium]